MRRGRVSLKGRMLSQRQGEGSRTTISKCKYRKVIVVALHYSNHPLVNLLPPPSPIMVVSNKVTSLIVLLSSLSRLLCVAFLMYVMNIQYMLA